MEVTNSKLAEPTRRAFLGMTGWMAPLVAMAAIQATACKADPLKSKSDGVVSVTDFGYIGRGNDTRVLERALETENAVSIPAGLTLVLVSDVVVRPGQSLFGAGSGARIRLKSNQSGDNVKIRLSNGATIRDIHLEEVDVLGRTGLYGTIFAAGVSQCLIQRVEISGSSSTGMMFLDSKDIMVDTCYVHDTMADGIHAQRGSQRVAIRNCRIQRTGDDGVAFVSHGYDRYGDVAECSVRDTIITDVHKTGSGVAVIGARDINVANCRIENTPMSGIRIASADFGTEGSVIAQRVVVSGNTIVGTGSGPQISNNGGIFVEGCRNVTIRANTIIAARSWGIATSNVVQELQIVANIITDPGDVGMFISTAQGNANYQRMWSAASARAGSRNLTVEGNSIVRPVKTGIHIAAQKGYPPTALIVRDNNINVSSIGPCGRATRAVFNDDNVAATIQRNTLGFLPR